MVKSVDNKSKSTSHLEFLVVGGHMLFMEKLLLCHWLEFFRGGFAARNVLLTASLPAVIVSATVARHQFENKQKGAQEKLKRRQQSVATIL